MGRGCNGAGKNKRRRTRRRTRLLRRKMTRTQMRCSSVLLSCKRQPGSELFLLLTLAIHSVTVFARSQAVEMSMRRPLHPYTSGLLRSAPRLSPRKSMLPVIRGRVPGASEMPAGCRFAPRCDFRSDPCGREQSISVYDVRRVRCWKHEELKLSGVK